MYRRRRIVATAGIVVIALMLGVGAFAMGRSSAADTASAAPSGPPPTNAGATDGCSVVEHSPEGAATTAASGLYELALADIGITGRLAERAKAVEKILTRYVVADQRSLMRQYLEASQSTLTNILDMPVAYQVVAYGQSADPAAPPSDASTAIIRLLVVDYGTSADGTSKSSSG